MIGIFKQKTPVNIFLLLVLGVVLKLPMFLHPHIPLAKNSDGVFISKVLQLLTPTGQSMMSRPTYFPGMAYMLITSLLPEWNHFSAPLIVNTILLFVLSGLFKIYNQPNAKGAIFNIGLALGVASFLFFPAITFIVWILLALTVMRPFKINEWMLCIVGITTPFYFYAIYQVKHIDIRGTSSGAGSIYGHIFLLACLPSGNLPGWREVLFYW